MGGQGSGWWGETVAVRRRTKKNKNATGKVNNEIAGIILIALAVFIIVGHFANTGIIGNLIIKALSVMTGKNGQIVVAAIFFILGAKLCFHRKTVTKGNPIGVLFFFILSLMILHLLPVASKVSQKNELIAFLWKTGLESKGGGIFGALLTIISVYMFGKTGTTIFLFALSCIILVMVTPLSLNQIIKNLINRLGKGMRFVKEKLVNFLFFEEEFKSENEKKDKNSANEKLASTPVIIDFNSNHEINEKELTTKLVEPSSNTNVQYYSSQSHNLMRNNSEKNYELPPLSLLSRSSRVKSSRLNKEIIENVRILEETLENFGVKVSVTQVQKGPAITRYEIQPAPGVKVSKIVHLADDIALSLAAPDVRIEAPIPGKAALGIEVPNKEISPVYLRDILECDEFQKAESQLTIALGKDIAGNPIVADLGKMPHLLIAGATGSGKSVCLNTLICSILYKAAPSEVKLLLIDPKMVELITFNGIPHLISPVITEPKKAASALRWLISEMENRYELFSSLGVRDISRYNNYYCNQDKEKQYRPLPYVVVVIDELADLMMVAPVEIEDYICRLAQMARAAGIHLVVATQRPTVDVITGIIKANIPSRIAFAVSSQTDSRTILDLNGAEKLLGRGDMLFLPVGAVKPIRIQGAYVTDNEVEDVVKFISSQCEPVYLADFPEHISDNSPSDDNYGDPLFKEAAKLVMEMGHASVSLLQRRFRIGYARAARIMDILEEKGVVGPFEGAKPRGVLMTPEQFNRHYGK